MAALPFQLFLFLVTIIFLIFLKHVSHLFQCVAVLEDTLFLRGAEPGKRDVFCTASDEKTAWRDCIFAGMVYRKRHNI